MEDHPAVPHIVDYLTERVHQLDPDSIKVIEEDKDSYRIWFTVPMDGRRIRAFLTLLNSPDDPNQVRCESWVGQLIGVENLRHHIFRGIRDGLSAKHTPPDPHPQLHETQEGV